MLFLTGFIHYRVANKQAEQEMVPNTQQEVSDKLTVMLGFVSEKRPRVICFNKFLIKRLSKLDQICVLFIFLQREER